MIQTDLNKSFYLITQHLDNGDEKNPAQSKEIETRLKIAENAITSLQSINEITMKKIEVSQRILPLVKESLNFLKESLEALSNGNTSQVTKNIDQLTLNVEQISRACYTTDIQDVILEELENFKETEIALAEFKHKINNKLFDHSIEGKLLAKFLQNEIVEENNVLKKRLLELLTFYRDKIHTFQSIPVEHIHSIAIFGHRTPEVIHEENQLREELHTFHKTHHDELVLRFIDGKFALQQLHYKNFELSAVTPIIQEIDLLSPKCTSLRSDIENIKKDMDTHGSRQQLDLKLRFEALQTCFNEINESIASINCRLKNTLNSVEWLPEENTVNYFIEKSTLKYQHSTEDKSLWNNLLFQPEDLQEQINLIYLQAELIVKTHQKLVDKISKKWNNLRTYFSDDIEDQLNRTGYSIEKNNCTKVRQFFWNYYKTNTYGASSPTQSVQEMLQNRI